MDISSSEAELGDKLILLTSIAGNIKEFTQCKRSNTLSLPISRHLCTFWAKSFIMGKICRGVTLFMGKLFPSS